MVVSAVSVLEKDSEVTCSTVMGVVGVVDNSSEGILPRGVVVGSAVVVVVSSGVSVVGEIDRVVTGCSEMVELAATIVDSGHRTAILSVHTLSGLGELHNTPDLSNTLHSPPSPIVHLNAVHIAGTPSAEVIENNEIVVALVAVGLIFKVVVVLEVDVGVVAKVLAAVVISFFALELLEEVVVAAAVKAEVEVAVETERVAMVLNVDVGIVVIVGKRVEVVAEPLMPAAVVTVIVVGSWLVVVVVSNVVITFDIVVVFSDAVEVVLEFVTVLAEVLEIVISLVMLEGVVAAYVVVEEACVEMLAVLLVEEKEEVVVCVVVEVVVVEVVDIVVGVVTVVAE